MTAAAAAADGAAAAVARAREAIWMRRGGLHWVRSTIGMERGVLMENQWEGGRVRATFLAYVGIVGSDRGASRYGEPFSKVTTRPFWLYNFTHYPKIRENERC